MGLLRSIGARLAPVFSGVSGATGGWWPVVREPYTGAWQHNDPITAESALSNPSVFGVVSRMASDISKITPVLLLERDRDGFWLETSNPAYSPVLRTPNRYQTDQQFVEQYILSKLLHGNTYVYKGRDERGVVNQLTVLDPLRVKPLVAPDGGVYYELQSNELAGLENQTAPVVVPASEIIHDRWNCAAHPLCGISPLFAASGAVTHEFTISNNSTGMFSRGRPSGILTAPGKIDPLSAQRVKEQFQNMKPGETALAEFGLTYQAIGITAEQAQLIQQLGWTEETICKVFGMPISMLNTSKQPPYANSDASQLQYKSQCLEPHMISFCKCVGQGLGLAPHLMLEFDDTLLSWMDAATRTKAAHEAVAAGVMTPNEARDTFFLLPPVTGGETPYLQQQYWSLAAAAKREQTPAPVAAPVPADEPAAELVTP